MGSDFKKENNKTVVLIGCEPTGHYWFAFAKYVNDHQKSLVMVNPFSVKKVKEIDDNSPKKTDSKDPKTIAKLVVCGWKVFHSIYARRHIRRNKRFGIQS